MCLIIVNRKEVLSREIFKNAFELNRDGMGLMFAQDNKIEIVKELKNINRFYNMYKEARLLFKSATICIHFRTATSGRNDLKNQHPFFINKNLAFMHNGVIAQLSSSRLAECDTFLFNELYLKKLPATFLENEGYIEKIKNFIGYSKLVFLNSSGKVNFVNENLGAWDEKENWFSVYP